MSQTKNITVISTNNNTKVGIRGGFVDYSKYRGYCCGCPLRIPREWNSNRCPQCNRLYRQKKKNKRADKIREQRKLIATL